MDVDTGDGDSLLDSEGEGDYGEQEDGKLRSKNPDLGEDAGIKKPSEAEDSDTQKLSGKNDKDTGDKRNVGENLLDPDLSHVIVDEVVDFDQFGAPPPDLPVVDDSERKQDKGIVSPDGESRATYVEKPKDHVVDTGMKDANDESSLMDTEGKEQRDPEPDVDPPPADDEETTAGESAASDLGVLTEQSELRDSLQGGSGGSLLENLSIGAEVFEQMSLEEAKQIAELRAELDMSSTQLEQNFKIHRELESIVEAEHNVQLNIEPTAEERAASDLQAMIEHPELRELIQAGPGKSLLEQVYRRVKELDDVTLEQEKQIGDLRAQVDYSNTQLGEKFRINEELTWELKAEHEERLKSEQKLMELQELLPDMEEKLKNSTDQVELLEVHLQEKAKVRKELENDVQEKTQLCTQVKQLSEQVHLHEVQLQEQAKVRKELENDLQEITQLRTQVKQLSEQVHLHEVQLQEQAS